MMVCFSKLFMAKSGFKSIKTIKLKEIDVKNY